MNNLQQKINEFKEFYDTKLDFHGSAITLFSSIIEPIPSVEAVMGRIKRYDECIRKFKRKYLPEIESKNSDYEISNYLTDLIGLRVTCFYLEDVYTIRTHLKKYFLELGITDKSILLDKSEDKFGYRSLHLDLVLNKKYSKLPKYKKFKDLRFELQIRTIIQDAWSVLDHKIKYKKSIPQSLKRRINRLSALFEIADDEFLRIKEEIAFEENKINERIKKGAPLEKDKPLDVFRFLFIALKYFPEYNFMEFKVDGFVQEILENNKYFTESDLNDAIQGNLISADQVAKNENKSLNPYTKIRYCLYLSNSKVFSAILSQYQKDTINNLKKIGRTSQVSKETRGE